MRMSNFCSWLGAAVKLLTVCLWLFSTSASAHEVLPSVADLSHQDGIVTMDIELVLEGFLASIDLSAVADTNEAEAAATYDLLRALKGPELEAQFRLFWPSMAPQLQFSADGARLPLRLSRVSVPDVGNIDLPRLSQIQVTAVLPAGAQSLDIGWNRKFGALVLRQMNVEDPYEAYIAGGTSSGSFPIAGGGQRGGWETFTDYIAVGFDHIVPKGLDHILFVLALFFLSPTLRSLLWQVSAFTLAHTITLAAGVTGLVSVPCEIVEPIIAASIVFVAVENIFTSGLSRWRPIVVFVFGLLHGLGFASVLQEFGLPADKLVPALIGFNIGVELGQLAVIACAFALVGYWFRSKTWYRAVISNPGSLIIALIGAFWFIERIGIA
jgi:hydrogenase/urease accessory protein HupE